MVFNNNTVGMVHQHEVNWVWPVCGFTSESPLNWNNERMSDISYMVTFSVKSALLSREQIP